jgi:hypothetical protein
MSDAPQSTSPLPPAVTRLDVTEEWQEIETVRRRLREAREKEIAKSLLDKIHVELVKNDRVKNLPGMRIEVTFRWDEWPPAEFEIRNAEHQVAYKILQELYGETRVRADPTPSETLQTLDFIVQLSLQTP